jgi:hypothetical protein
MQIDSLESAYSYLCQGGETLSILVNFFKIYKSLQQEIALKISDLSFELECSELVKPLNATISVASSFIKQVSNKHLQTSE